MATLNVPTNDRRHIPERRTTPSGERHTVKMAALDYIAMALLIVGGLNWAWVALSGVDVVAAFFGIMSPAARVFYILVGIAALYGIYLAVRMATAARRESHS